jgi:hypothetical protein
MTEFGHVDEESPFPVVRQQKPPLHWPVPVHAKNVPVAQEEELLQSCCPAWTQQPFPLLQTPPSTSGLGHCTSELTAALYAQGFAGPLSAVEPLLDDVPLEPPLLDAVPLDPPLLDPVPPSAWRQTSFRVSQ